MTPQRARRSVGPIAILLAASSLLAYLGGPVGAQVGDEGFVPTGPDRAAPAAPAPLAVGAAPDPQSELTPDYFPPVYRALLRAPLPARIYRQGGVPAVIDRLESYRNPHGYLGTYLPRVPVVTANNAFFQALGTNGRACVTCHQPPSGMSISLRNVRARFRNTNGTDPLFAPVDGADCPSAVPAKDTAAAPVGWRVGRGSGPLQSAYSVLLSRAAIRMPLPWPPQDKAGALKPVEFRLAISPADDRPGCNNDAVDGLPAGLVSVYRRPPSAAQMNFKTLRVGGTGRTLAGSIMWDGRESSLEIQAINATLGHSQALSEPTPEKVRQIVAFVNGIFVAQLADRDIGRLDRNGGGGGPVNLSNQLPFPAIGFTFVEYTNWAGREGKLVSIARGQALFNTRPFTVGNVDGFNDQPGVGNPASLTTCSTCHNIFASGADFLARPQRNIGIGGTAVAFGGPAAAKDLPRFTLTCNAGVKAGFQGRGPIVTNDPGLALITGKCADIGKFTVPQLRALAAREPYFHDGSAQTLATVVRFYNRRFGIGLSREEQKDLVNFLAAL